MGLDALLCLRTSSLTKVPVRYGPIFQFAIFGHETLPLAKKKFQKLHIYCVSTPGGQIWAYFWYMGSGFQDMGGFSKLPYLGMKLGHWPKFQKLHIYYSLSTPGGRNWAYFHSTDSGYEISIFRHETWTLAKVSEVAHIPVLPFYPKGWKLSLVLIYGQRFPRYGLIFDIAIFGHKTWQLAKVPEVAHISRRNWAYFRYMGSVFRDTGPFSKLPYLGMKFGNWPKFQKLYIPNPSKQTPRAIRLKRSTDRGVGVYPGMGL